MACWKKKIDVQKRRPIVSVFRSNTTTTLVRLKHTSETYQQRAFVKKFLLLLVLLHLRLHL